MRTVFRALSTCLAAFMLALFLCITAASPVAAQEPGAAQVPAAAPAPTAQAFEFRSGEAAQSANTSLPATGWAAVKLPATWRGVTGGAIWVRFTFYLAPGETAPLALYSDRVRERYALFLNGVDIHRSNGGPTDRSFGWHRPLFIALPDQLLHAGANTLMLRVESAHGRPLAVGLIRVGPDAHLRTVYRWRSFASVGGPQLITGVIVILSLGALLFWLVRPQERVFGWLALMGAAWSFWNLQYFIDSVPFDDRLFWMLNADDLFVLTWTAYAFAVTFLDIPGRTRFIRASALACVVAIACRHLLLHFGLSDAPSYLLVWPFALATLYLLARACYRAPKAENFAMLAALMASTLFGFHDLVLVSTGWRGVTFQLQPYGGFLLFLAFGFALGRRMLVSLATVEDLNATLETRVQTATRDLQESEAQRRKLEVSTAIDGERERLMREIHDGIGSSLITALAVAQRDQQSPGTIATLKRSIADLRIGIDSLEPINGDVVILLANLRHRMDRELRDAGLVFVWKSMVAPPLPWLDAVGALHILRILQEAIGNILKHAAATRVEIDCSGALFNGADGVMITIVDNGRGYDPASATHGRGLANMQSRAEALHAILRCTSILHQGTALSLWLPLDQ
jgi:signal transduction histidine kinase